MRGIHTFLHLLSFVLWGKARFVPLAPSFISAILPPFAKRSLRLLPSLSLAIPLLFISLLSLMPSDSSLSPATLLWSDQLPLPGLRPTIATAIIHASYPCQVESQLCSCCFSPLLISLFFCLSQLSLSTSRTTSPLLFGISYCIPKSF